MFRFDLDHPSLRLGLVRADGVRCIPSASPLIALLEEAEQRVRADPTVFPEQVRARVRDVLRVGGYKPTGRGKPASELLLAMALKEGLPRIANLVEINNLASLETGLPISVFDADQLGDDVSMRFGRAGEQYVFNASGQSMDLSGLPLICRGSKAEPVGNAVRDSMLCKVHPSTARVFAVVYGTTQLPDALLSAACERLRQLLCEHAGAAEVEIAFAPAA
jgi:DNA/RNA-binding domain of Phe-tRNA-synthetase-like protein